MNAKEVIEKILSDAKTEADQINGQGNRELSAVTAEYESELNKFDMQTKAMAQDAANDKTLRLLAAARMESARKVLKAKRESLDAVFAKAKDKLANLDDNKYLALIEALLISSIETGDESVVIGKNESRITDDFIKKVNRNLGTGFKGNLLLSSNRADICGGFILKRGDISINVSFDVLIDMARGELEADLAKELFQS